MICSRKFLSSSNLQTSSGAHSTSFVTSGYWHRQHFPHSYNDQDKRVVTHHHGQDKVWMECTCAHSCAVIVCSLFIGLCLYPPKVVCVLEYYVNYWGWYLHDVFWDVCLSLCICWLLSLKCQVCLVLSNQFILMVWKNIKVNCSFTWPVFFPIILFNFLNKNYQVLGCSFHTVHFDYDTNEFDQ